MKNKLFIWIKSNKELTVIWIAGIASIVTFLLAPRRHVAYVGQSKYVVSSDSWHYSRSFPILSWDIIIPIIITIVILSGLVIMTLRAKK